MYPPELDTLDQLLGGDMTLNTIRRIFPSDHRFQKAILAMLHEGEIRLLGKDGTEPPRWQWALILGDSDRWFDYRLSLTDLGSKRA